MPAGQFVFTERRWRFAATRSVNNIRISRSASTIWCFSYDKADAKTRHVRWSWSTRTEGTVRVVRAPAQCHVDPPRQFLSSQYNRVSIGSNVSVNSMTGLSLTVLSSNSSVTFRASGSRNVRLPPPPE